EAYVKIKTGEPTVALRQIVGANAQEIAVIASGVTVMFQLMPNQLYPSIRVDGESGANWLMWDPRLERDSEPAGPYTLNDPYSIYRERSGRLGLLNHSEFEADAVLIRNGVWASNTRLRLRRILANIDRSEQFHTRTVGDYVHPQTYLITGSGLDTTVQARQNFQQRTVYGVQLNSEGLPQRIVGQGDGTVAVASGRAFEPHANCQGRIVLRGIEHAAAFNNGLVITGMLSMIRRARQSAGDQTW
ncbi:MAG: hypothetical protein H7039_19700, partial [Bryobacteraceae bacterium]|nr:hypothetical protein [Bryobacteraceae bacterium]